MLRRIFHEQRANDCAEVAELVDPDSKSGGVYAPCGFESSRRPVPPLRREARQPRPTALLTRLKRGRFSRYLPQAETVSASRRGLDDRDKVDGGGSVRKRASIGLLRPAVGALALVAAGCGGRAAGRRRRRRRQRDRAPGVVLRRSPYGGEGDPDYLIASDLPLQGGSRTQTMQMNEAIGYVLEQQDWKAGDNKIALPGVRRRDGPAREVGHRQVQRERERLQGQRQADRPDRDVQLGLRRDRDPGAQPGAGRRDAPGLAREHVRLPDGAVRGQRAGEVLPERQAKLRPRRAERPEPGCGRSRSSCSRRA